MLPCKHQNGKKREKKRGGNKRRKKIVYQKNPNVHEESFKRNTEQRRKDKGNVKNNFLYWRDTISCVVSFVPLFYWLLVDKETSQKELERTSGILKRIHKRIHKRLHERLHEIHGISKCDENDSCLDEDKRRVSTRVGKRRIWKESLKDWQIICWEKYIAKMSAILLKRKLATWGGG